MSVEAERRDGPEPGAVSVGDPEGRRKRGLAWLWALLALALIAAAAVFLLARNAWDEGDDSGLDLTNDPSRSGEDADDASTDERSSDEGDVGDGSGAVSTPTTADAGSGETGSGGDSPASDSPLTSNGEALLPLPAEGLAAYAGQPAEAKSVAVESVVSDEGFWVGANAQDRVFVRLVTAGAESPVQIQPGRRVSFTGTVTPNPPDVSTLGVTPDEGADLLTQQTHHIEVQLSDIQQG